MSHEETRKCDKCGWSGYAEELTYRRDDDEYWCDNCIDNEAEAAYDRQQERDLESPPESTREQQIRTWEEHQKAHKR